MEITIRLAIPSDASGMAETSIRSWEVAYKDILPIDYIREKNTTRMEQFKHNITDENENSYVIQIDNKTIGIMKIAPPVDDDLDDNYYELHYIYLQPNYFGQGIGAQAVDFAFDKVRELGKKYISLWVFSENENSIKFYEKCGFRRDGRTAIQDRGKATVIIRMRKDLLT